MSESGFYTPKTPCSKFYTPRAERSDSEESGNGEYVPCTPSNNSDSGELSLVAEFDDVVRLIRVQRNDEIEDVFLVTVEKMQALIEQQQVVMQECQRLQCTLDVKVHELSDLEGKLNRARKIVDQQKEQTRKIADERDDLQNQIDKVRQFLFRDTRARLPDDFKDKLAFLNTRNSYNWDPNVSAGQEHLSAIQEVNTTGSLLSDFSYSRSDNDLDISVVGGGRTWKKHRPSHTEMPESCMKKRRSSTGKVVEISNTDSVRATTTVTVPKHGPITATSIIESIPMPETGSVPQAEVKHKQPSAPPADLIHDLWQNSPQPMKPTMRYHNLQTKTVVVMPETCGPCESRIRFGKTALKCKDCRAICHVECKNNLPLPCIPYVNTPTQRNLLGLISDYAPTTAPMVPAIIVHCTNEIELRGFSEIGIYRIPGSEKDVKQLKEKFLRGKGSPSLSQVDVHVICGTVKDFLRFLHEPLVTFKLWPLFVKCVETQKQQNITAGLIQILSELPQPNRDTLAYLILHLKRVAEAKECKMPISNLAKIFGPTIVGYSCSNPDTANLLTETRQQNMVMEWLMNLPTDYWSSFVNVVTNIGTPKLQQTPSTDSLLRPGRTPYSARCGKRKHKFFPTPPYNK